jgi:hypothetical protein
MMPGGSQLSGRVVIVAGIMGRLIAPPRFSDKKYTPLFQESAGCHYQPAMHLIYW